jgi:dTDP-4-dehydrorhamnose reductase
MAIILVTGASGQLGNELKKVSDNFYGYDFIFTDIDTLDITDQAVTKEFIKRTGPNWIVNCAAYNSVDKADSEYEKALLINSKAVKNISESIAGTDCRFIHISTDYVYDGRSNVPYSENILPNPVSAYGKSKHEGEKAALLHSHSMVIRTAWLYSSFGSNFVKTIIRHAKEKESLKVVFDQTGTPTYAADLAEAIMKIISGVIRNHFAFSAGIYNYSNEGVCSWYDFAVEIVREAELNCKIIPILSADYNSAAPRPSFSVLDKSKIKETYELEIPHWRVSLKKCINLLREPLQASR